MNNQQGSFPVQNATIQLEVVPEDEQQVDIADIDEVGRDLFEQLRSKGYVVTPTVTGRKGGGPIFDILLQMPQFLHDNKDWLLASIPPVLECLLILRDKRAEREKAKRTPLKITLEVDGKPLTIETSDLNDAVKLVAQLQMTHSQSAMKIKVHVPKKKRHHSH